MADQQEDTEIIESLSPELEENREKEPSGASRAFRSQMVDIILIFVLFLVLGGLLYYWNISRISVPNVYDKTQENTGALKPVSDTTEEQKAIQEIDQMNFESINADIKGLDEIGDSL